MVKGKVVSFVAKKNFGFINGEDGESYFFHTSFLKDQSAASILAKGVNVEFDPTPAKKGMEARSLVVHQATLGKRYRKFIRTKENAPKDGFVERRVHLKTRAFKSPDEGREHLTSLAHQMGGNALLNYQYEKSTAVSGNYRYSVHSFSADVAVVSETVSFANEAEKQRASSHLSSQISKFDGFSKQTVKKEDDAKSNQTGFQGCFVVILFFIFFIILLNT